MSLLEGFVSDLQDFLIGNRKTDHNIIRRHTKRLEELGDISFPLKISNWHHLMHTHQLNTDCLNIFDYNSLGNDLKTQLEQLKSASLNWKVQVAKVVVNKTNSDVHIYISRTPLLFKNVLKEVIESGSGYGKSEIIKNKVHLHTHPRDDFTTKMSLSCLRLHLLKEVTSNFLKTSTCSEANNDSVITLALCPVENDTSNILCGPVLSEKGKKSSTTAEELYKKRSSDMRMMAQHKYGVQIKPTSSWETYFENLGKGSVTIEMMSNKPQKPIKITQNDLQTANKGASFIFYNCARLAALFKEFGKLISKKMYPELPKIDSVDFSLLSQQEEWELFYIYILQYPIVVKNCIKDIERGVVNPQYLIAFLSNFTSIFSVYYRRVRILTNPREHMFAVIHARIYLLRAIQLVFHNALSLLNIEPIKEM